MLPRLLLALTLAGQAPDYDLLGRRPDRGAAGVATIARQLARMEALVGRVVAQPDRPPQPSPARASRPRDRYPHDLR